MCFKNLPIEFDPHGQPRFTGDWEARPQGPPDDDRLAKALERNAQLRSFDIDPVTRVAGALSFHTTVDLEHRQVVDARTEATLFRGYEVILKGRDPVDAIHISSRACGVCGGVHATCAAMALEMAFGVVPPPLAIIARNLGQGAELLYDHTLHLFLLAGPDYSEVVGRSTSPSLWERAKKAEAPRAAAYGLRTVGDIMSGLNPLRGELYLEALHITRGAREIASLMMGKYPHPSTIFPGGIGIEPSTRVFNQVLGRIVHLLDYAKKVVAVWDDLIDFLLRLGKTEMSTPYRVPTEESLGVGLWEAGRGTLTHHVVVEGGRIANYQIVTPSTWMASPRDPFGSPGPYEEAVMNTPLLEEFERPEDFTGIDILRTVRSFDPCMPCTVHLYAGERVLHRDATSCACGLEA